MTETMTKRRGTDGSAATAQPEVLPTGVAPLREDHPNPLIRAMPVTWEVPRSAELVDADERLAALRSEAAGLDERYAAAIGRGDSAAMVEARVRADLLPDLLEAAEVVCLRLQRAWLLESRALTVPHSERIMARLDELRAERDRVDEAINEVETAGGEVGAASVYLSYQSAEINRRLNQLTGGDETPHSVRWRPLRRVEQ